MQSTLSARLVIPALLVLLVGMASCASSRPQSVIALPNGYYVQPTKSGQLSVVKRSGGTVVPGPIAAYSVFRKYVVGALGAAPPLQRTYTNDLPFQGTADTRYFVLDTKAGKLDSGLDEAAWKKELAALAIPASTEIYSPILPD